MAHRADVPVLIVRAHEDADAASEADRPILVCFDGSDEARAAVDAAAELLTGREMVVVSFLEPVDDVALLRQTLPWPPPAETERRLARVHRRGTPVRDPVAGKHGAAAGSPLAPAAPVVPG